MIPALFAVGTGIASYLQKSSIYDDKIEQRNRYVDSLKDLAFDKDEITTRLDNVRDTFNPAIVSDINNTAVGNAITGILNPDIYSSLIPQKAQAVANERGRIEDFNNNVTSKIAEANLIDIPRPGVFDFLGGAIEGYGYGVQIDALTESPTERLKALAEQLKILNGEGSTLVSPKPVLKSNKRQFDSPFDFQ